MKVDCRWMEKNLEAFFSDELKEGDLRSAQEHLQGCTGCQEAVRELEEITPLVRHLFRQDLAVAQMPPRRRSPLLIGAAVAAAATIALVVGLQTLKAPEAQPVQQSQVPAASATAPAVEPEPAAAVTKIPDGSLVVRSKPEPARELTDGLTNSNAAVEPDRNSPEFLVMDSAGYSRTLKDYRENVLIMGIWEQEQVQAVAMLEQIYGTYGQNTRVRVLGVTNQRQARPTGATFPVAYNQASKLLGAKTGEFVVVDQGGIVRLRGSLRDGSSGTMNSIGSLLADLGIH